MTVQCTESTEFIQSITCSHSSPQLINLLFPSQIIFNQNKNQTLARWPSVETFCFHSLRFSSRLKNRVFVRVISTKCRYVLFLFLVVSSGENPRVPASSGGRSVFKKAG